MTMENGRAGPVANLRRIFPRIKHNNREDGKPLSRAKHAVKVFSDHKEEGQIPLPDAEDGKHGTPSDVRQGSELTKTRSRWRSFHRIRCIQMMKWMKPLFWQKKRPTKGLLKIGTQNESLKATYNAKINNILEKAPQPSEQQPESFAESFMSSCLCQESGSTAYPGQTEPQTTSSVAAQLADDLDSAVGLPIKVKLSHVRTHYHFKTLGNQLTVKQGAPLSLGKFMVSSSMSVNRFERLCRCTVSRPRDLLIPADRRREILLRAGVTKWEMNRCERMIQAKQKKLYNKKSLGCIAPSSIGHRKRGAVRTVIKIVSQYNAKVQSKEVETG